VKLNTTPRIAVNPDLLREIREHANQVNSVSEGRIHGSYNAVPSVPTAGGYQQGDFVRNSAPTELGIPGMRYVIFGWLRTDSGFEECRFLTGG
jgi:hypothetical protein